MAFPSHPGLVAPLWRRWPDRFDAWALGIGAVLPDAVDSIISPIFRGNLGQWLGHSLFGAAAICWPLGLLGFFLAGRLRKPVAISLLVGCYSHICFDLISHAEFPLLYPWAAPHPFPAWWTAAWFTVPLPFYAHPYPVGPPVVVWTLLSIAGGVLFFYRGVSTFSRGVRASK